jgi:hypothetical protein
MQLRDGQAVGRLVKSRLYPPASGGISSNRDEKNAGITVSDRW